MWNNKRPGATNTGERLGHAVVNREWKEKFSASTLIHGFNHVLDHVSILLQTKTDRDFKGRGPCGFRFEESWLLWEECEGVVMESWSNSGGGVVDLRDTTDKIRSYGTELLAWGSSKTTLETKEIK